VLVSLLFLYPIFVSNIAQAEESICYGTTSKGRLENPVALPSVGNNYVSYGKVPKLAGRTYVHSKVRDVVLNAYAILEAEKPKKVFKYAETGLKNGGEFKPHKTHQNGLSVDFIVPVVDERGRSVHLPTHPLNKYGYSIEFNEKGNYKNYEIDAQSRRTKWY
jgi:penicillin-insensitive murein endopeptidase